MSAAVPAFAVISSAALAGEPANWTLYNASGTQLGRYASVAMCQQAKIDRSSPGDLCVTVGDDGLDPARSPPVDPTKLLKVRSGPLPQAKPAHRYTNERIKKLDLDAAGELVNPAVSRAHANPDDIGAFRESCEFAGMNYDDALVFPGQPGVSHLHTYFGVLSNATTTSDNVRAAPWSTCAGGTLNNTSYWMPAVIDTRTGTPQVPSGNNVYYKCPYGYGRTASEACRNIVPVPVGLHLITGRAGNRNPATPPPARFICMGPKGENPGWKPTIDAAFADGTCLPGGSFVIEMHFPECWDGVNLDSPDHQSHVVGPVDVRVARPPSQGGDYYFRRCPATHPKQLPAISYNIGYSIPDAQAVGRWRLSSDLYDPRLPAGLSAHADYLMGWKPEIVELFTKHCLNEQRDCHNYLLGDNKQTLY